MAASDQRPLHPLRVLSEVRAAFARETTVAIDVGVLAQGMGGGFPYFPVNKPRSLIVPSSFYGMGFSGSALPVAKLVHPDRPAAGFVGDGSFQVIMNVLPTAAECRLPVTWCVLNDRTLGPTWDGQRARYGNRVVATVQPNFAAIAQACQCYGEKVEGGRHPPGDRARTRGQRARKAGCPRLAAGGRHHSGCLCRREHRAVNEGIHWAARHRPLVRHRSVHAPRRHLPRPPTQISLTLAVGFSGH
jgi:acetolactate synthase-1/2/3 large subunit